MDTNFAIVLFVAWVSIIVAGIGIAWLLVRFVSWLQWRETRAHKQRVQLARERALIVPIRGFNPARDERGRYVRDGVPRGLVSWMARNRGR